MTIPSLLTKICAAILEQPVRLVITYGAVVVLIEIFAQGDIGPLIGREGRLSKALGRVARAAGKQEGKMVYVRVERE